MNVDTGHLVDTTDMSDEEKVALKLADYLPVIEKLQEEAAKALHGKKEVVVDLNSKSKLTKWAALTRKQRRKLKIKSYKDYNN